MNSHPLDDDSHTSGQHRAKKVIRPSMDRDLHDSSGAPSGHDVEVLDDGECSESGFGSDEDSFGAASDDCEPDQSYLESVLQDYHPERVNLLDQSVPEPITTPKVEAVTQERRLSRSMQQGSLRFDMMKSRDLMMKDLQDSSSDSDSNTKEKENKKQPQSQSSDIVSEPAIPASTNGTVPTVAIDASESADGDGDGDVDNTNNNNACKISTKQEQSTEDNSESGVGEGEADDQFPSSPVPPPKHRPGLQQNRPGISSRPGLEHQGNSTKKSFRSINGKNFWSKPFRKVVKTMKRGSSKKDKNVDKDVDPSSS